MRSPSNVDLLEELCTNANMGKYRHFDAASRNSRLHTWIGIPVVCINLALGSALFVALTQEITTYAKWIGAFLALAAAIGSSLQTFFNFSRRVEGHRRIANRYLALAKECQYIQGQFTDGLLNLQDISQRLGTVLDQYQKINVDAEAYPTGNREFKVALKQEKERKMWLERKYGNPSQEEIEPSVEPTPSPGTTSIRR